MDITPTQSAALKWLRDRGGTAVVTKRGSVMAAGEISGREWRTWEALSKHRLIRIIGNRISLAVSLPEGGVPTGFKNVAGTPIGAGGYKLEGLAGAE